ncbi:hypothetical protein [Rodentibacter pneumotropicus]|uniref:Uncharacterized protein n=1 Tax=Rodentibacter pneumotropicus TaxID=758 RepID=A0A4S2Q1W7_9PAST|nr:hypothetical protein [Rodentibacter pneumotropicus]THA10483.1 hypothetical protein D3M78_02990 [Rodentibacter pneumotropicus]
MKFKFLGVFKRLFNRLFQRKYQKTPARRPRAFSKNAWSYVSRGKPTAAEVIMWRLYDGQ